tara:strand:- start:1044 stop:1850 length:807 start_codon:yes stop_codon:yes gene_type:complete
MKNLILNFFLFILSNKLIFRFFAKFKQLIDNNIIKIKHNDFNAKFYNNSWITDFRYRTFSSKEPETLDWIDNFSSNSVFWDIGANIGLYSIYAAKKKSIRVYSFEPSPLNIELLVKNISINFLKNIIVIPIAITDKIKVDKFKMSNVVSGGALSVFGEEYDQDGNPFKEILSFHTLGADLNSLESIYKISKPNYIKIDVDGIEHLILQGATKILDQCKSILIEINDEFTNHSEQCLSILKENGFKNTNIEYQKNIRKNQIWVKNVKNN